MASSSSSGSNSQCRPRKYDVFLSFRGEDTRNTFTGHLYEGLKIRGIRTFKDDIELKYGDPILEELSTAIEESQVALVLFSKDYAASKWCLEELVRIMECNKKKQGLTVMPVFYNVDPSHVRHQRGSFAEAFAKHESNYKDDVEGRQKVEGWRAALWEAANLSGCDIRTRIESECIRDLVGEISKLCKTSLFYLENIVGINTHLEEVKSQLQMEINDVRIVGIWGMGGVGKTTIARAIFNTHSYQFEAASFLADIKENEKKNQLHSLQNTLLSELLRTKYDHVSNKYAGKDMIQSRFRFMKVLIVLDDINERHQLEYLAEDADWFGYGSRVVVTTRNRDLIMNANAIYEVIPLPDLEAMQLFNQYAFGKEDPDERFKKLSLEVVNHAKGLPLALKLWGCSLHKKDQTRWEIIVDQIKKTPDSDVIQKLKISYDGLKSEEQEIFLDMACFFRGKEKKEVMQILESCGFGAKYGLDILIDKALVFIDPEYDMIQMHDLIQDMGKYIVKMQKVPGERSRLKDLGERSRLWDAEDITEVMTNNTGTEAVEAVWISFYDKRICFSKEAMKNMKMLRILHIKTYKGSACDNGVIEYLSNNLRWCVWHAYPWKSLPAKFEPKKLVHLELWGSELCQLCKETKHFPCLRKLDLSWCRSLMRTPDFRAMPNLEYLYLHGCSNLEEVDDSLGYCGKLIRLYFNGCSSLKRFPCVSLESLEYLDLQWCSSLEKFPEIKGRSKLGLRIEMAYSGIREIPSFFFQSVAHLTKLDLRFMKHLVSLPSSICKLKSLVKLNVSDCSKLESLPEEIGDLENLEKLDASCTLVSRPPSSIARLNKLKSLSFRKYISGVSLRCLVFPSVNDGLRSLEDLDLSCCNLINGGLPEDIGCLSSLKKLNLHGNNFEHLPLSIAQLGALQSLDLSFCERLKELPGFMGMPNLETLNLSNCTDLEEVHHSLGYCGKLIRLYLNGCSSLKWFPCVNLESLEYLYLTGCSSLEKFPEIKGRSKLGLEIEMNDSGIREIPSSFFQSVAHLTKLDLRFMKHLVSLPSSICKLKSLVKLNLSDCSKLESLPEEIGDLENLEKLDAHKTLISRLPSSIVRLNKLKFLSLSYCNLRFGGLPEEIGCLSSLKELYLDGNKFEQLPRSIAQLAALLSLDLSDCKRLKELPSFMGMPNLATLNLSNCMNLEEVHHSLGFLKKLCQLRLTNCKGLKRFPALCIDSLESLALKGCSSLENFPKLLGSMNLELDSGISDLLGSMNLELDSGISDLNHYLDLSGLENLVTLPSSICKLISLVMLNVSDCSKLESLPEEVGDLENLEKLYVKNTLISRPPSSIIRLNKLKILSFEKQKSEIGVEDGVCFVFPQVNEGLQSLEYLDLSCCNLIDGGLPEDIGCLSSLKKLNLRGNNFEHLPRSIAQLGALQHLYLSHCPNLKEFPQMNDGLRSLEDLDLSYSNLVDGGLPEDIGSLSSLKKLYLTGNNFEHLPQSIAQLGALQLLCLSDCYRLVELPEFPQQLDTIYADWSNDSLCNSLFQNISSLQRDISTSDSLSLRVFTSGKNIPSWFHHQGIGRSVSINLPENWYVSDNFLGFAVCSSGRLTDTTAHLIPLCNDGMPWITQELALCNHSKYDTESAIQFFLVPSACLWDTSKANGKTPKDYGLIRLCFYGEMEYGFRLLYKDEPKLEALLQMRGNSDEPTEHCSSCSKARGIFVFENLQQQVKAPVSSETLQLFPTSPGFLA